AHRVSSGKDFCKSTGPLLIDGSLTAAVSVLGARVLIMELMKQMYTMPNGRR
ncbi:hypothetical protein Pcinc_025013, partial [Petrolisthes cinctipes]